MEESPPHLNNKVTTTDEHSKNLFSHPATIFLALILVYITCITLWFIQSRYCVSARRGSAFLSLLRHRLALWKGTLFRNNSNIHQIYYDNLPHYQDLDERQYKSWSVLEVASWSRSKLAAIQSNGNHQRVSSSYFIDNASTQQYHESKKLEDDKMILQQAIDALMQQQIDGASLEYLTLEYLSRWMPFGTAAHLFSQYDALISTYSIQEGNNVNNALSGDDLPSWYNDNQLHQARKNNHQDVEAQEDDTMSPEHVQQLMKDRFGLPLPSLRTDSTTDTKDASNLEMTNRASSIRETQAQKQAANTTLDNSNNLDDILKAMPPHIRAVAERRPDLVAELLTSRQQQQQQLIPIHDEDSVGEGEEADFDSESESLLRRRIR